MNLNNAQGLNNTASSALVLYQTLLFSLHLMHLLYEIQVQMEWTRFLYLLFETTSALHYILSSTFTGYIMFIVAIWTLSFSCYVIHLVKISKSILDRWQKTYFSTLLAHKNISIYRQCLSKENAVLFKHQLFIYPFIAKKRRSVSSRLCAVRQSEWRQGEVTRFHWEMTQWRYKVFLTSSF